MNSRAMWIGFGLSVTAFACGAMDTAVAAGVVSITQEKAITGGISSGDGPGFPILITDPGSYRLDSDLYPAGAPYGIFISSPNVTIDFNGFRLYGGPTRPNGDESSDGILGSQPGATIRNGTITNFLRYGIFTGADSWTIEDMNVLSTGPQSADAGSDAVTCGRLCVVRDSIVARSRGKGVRAGEASLVEGSMIGANCGNGIEMLQGGMVLGNIITLNNCGSPARAIVGDASDPNVAIGNNVITLQLPPIGTMPLAPNACDGGC
jgi:Right handed beta helix region